MDKIEEVKKILTNPQNWLEYSHGVGLDYDKVSLQICQLFERYVEVALPAYEGEEITSIEVSSWGKKITFIPEGICP